MIATGCALLLGFGQVIGVIHAPLIQLPIQFVLVFHRLEVFQGNASVDASRAVEDIEEVAGCFLRVVVESLGFPINRCGLGELESAKVIPVEVELVADRHILP